MHESGCQSNDNYDEEEEDIMQYARQQSLRQLEIDSYKMTKGVHYDAGGSSASQQRKRMLGRSFSVRNTVDTQNPRGNNPQSSRFAPPQLSTPAERLRAIEVDLEIERDRKKQTKIKSTWFKKSKEKMMNAFGRFVVHNRLPFAVAESPWTRPLLRLASEVGPNIPPLTAYELAEV